MSLTCSAVDLATAKAKITINFVCPILLKRQMWLIVIKRNVFVVWGIIHRPPYESRTIHGKPQSIVNEKFPIMKEKANKTQNIAHREKIVHVTLVETFFAFLLTSCPALDSHTPQAVYFYRNHKKSNISCSTIGGWLGASTRRQVLIRS